jgi:hypothetical protein
VLRGDDCAMKKHILAAASLAVFAIAPRTGAQLATTSTYVVTRGADTVAIERVTRTGSSLVGDLRLPQGERSMHAHYTVALRPDGGAARVDVIDDVPNFFTGILVFDGAGMSAAQREVGALNDRVAMAPPGTYPTVGTSIALMEQVVRATHPAVGATVRAGVVNIRNGNRAAMEISRVSADSVFISCDGCMRAGAVETLHLAIDKEGGITGGTNPDFNWSITRR